jgi:uncharacterized protein YjbI with pentapeptide repeats
MADESHVERLKQDVGAWNQWRLDHPEITPNLINAPLNGADLRGADLSGALLLKADLRGANLCSAVLRRANLCSAELDGALLIRANLIGAYLKWALLTKANLCGADLSGANLTRARLDEANIAKATLTGCAVYGLCVWGLKGAPKEQLNLVISPKDALPNEPVEPVFTVDYLEMAPFIYLLTRYETFGNIIDATSSKVVLILGRFGQRLSILKAIQEQLRNYRDEEGKARYIPFVFDFEGPESQDLMTTVRTIAHMSRFIIADLTAPKSAAAEVHDIVPQLKTAVKLIMDISSGEQPPSVLGSDLKYEWLIPEVYGYSSVEELCANLESYVISPAEEKRRELKKAEAKFVIETS